MSLPIVALLMWSGLESESAKRCLEQGKKEIYKSNCHTSARKSIPFQINIVITSS